MRHTGTYQEEQGKQLDWYTYNQNILSKPSSSAYLIIKDVRFAIMIDDGGEEGD